MSSRAARRFFGVFDCQYVRFLLGGLGERHHRKGCFVHFRGLHEIAHNDGQTIE